MIQKVRTSVIQTGAVVGNTLGPTSVSTNNIVVGAITSNLIASRAITGNLIANNAVSGNNIVSPPDIFDDALLFGGM